MRVRVSAVQYRLCTIASWDAFAAQVRQSVAAAAEFEPDFVLFPELLTTQLLSIGDGRGNALPFAQLPAFTQAYHDLFAGLARDTGMYILGGTHVVQRGDTLQNVAFLFGPDGQVVEQPKLHLTPTEVQPWGVTPGDKLRVFATRKGTVAILICYDAEFPELARMARARGADVIFCPSCTDDEHGFWRVRYSCHARAVENQVYVVTTGTVGALPSVPWMRSNFGQAAMLTPNDLGFPPRGVLAEGVVNQEMVITADLDLERLYEVRERGGVRPWQDRRTDLYPDWT
ncbi:MAG: carbon-nitrogen hydrolase family protein [Alicyclobacillus sp.]|nr:carbon-nitrogen hydrolase family protein [Alicyclobacillus sp.]